MGLSGVGSRAHDQESILETSLVQIGGFMKAQGQALEQQELLPGWEGCLALSGRSGRAPSGFPVSKKTHRLPGLMQTLPSSR